MRRSVEDSLQRMGMAYLDVAFIHDCCSICHGDNYPKVLRQVIDEAIPELQKMKRLVACSIQAFWRQDLRARKEGLPLIRLYVKDFNADALKSTDTLNKLHSAIEVTSVRLKTEQNQLVSRL